MRTRFSTRGHDKTLSERSIEEILFLFPYLIDKRLSAHDLDERGLTFDDSTRTDITFSNDSEIIIVELKRDIINIAALQQLLNYLRKALSRNGRRRKVSGILIGLEIRNEEELQKVICDSGFDVSLKIYGKDVPTTIKFCKNKKCRKAVSTADSVCNFCGGDEFFY